MTNEFKLILAISGIVTAGVAYIFTENQRNITKQENAKRETKRLELYKVEKEAALPPEYWSAKEAATNAELETNKAKLDTEYRLEIDKRNRADEKEKAIREFEKDAPESYWNHKRLQEEEKTKREQLRIEDEKSKRMAKTEYDIAERNAKAIENGAKTIERVVRNNQLYGSGMTLL
ncbi:MAG: hypothetical protein J6U54_12060 [Clostridiales bacterium]|nr:hypothetical protein [Clostridiales bacterium]